MTRAADEIEREIRGARARLDDTKDRHQDGFAFTGLIDELKAAMRSSEYGPLLEDAVAVVRRNPGPVLLIGAGLGWLLYRISQDRDSGLGHRVHDAVIADRIPVLNTGNARVYDPDHSPRHPAQDSLETRREASARA